MKLICAALVLLMTVPAFAAGKSNGDWLKKGDTFTGVGFAIDGDSLFVDTERGRVEVRLFGISAPEYDAPFGPFASRKLHELVYGKTLTCADTGGRTHNRIVAICRRGGLDVGADMIVAGAATPYRYYLHGADPDLLEIYFGRERGACRQRWGLWINNPGGICESAD